MELVEEWRSGASTAQEPQAPPPPGLTLTWEISSTLSSKDAWLLNILGGWGAQEEKEARSLQARMELLLEDYEPGSWLGR